MLNRNISRERR